MSLDPKAQKLLTELVKREKAKSERPKFVLEEYCFDKQLEFINDPNKFKTAVCSRRAGKTEACSADLFDAAMKHPGTNCLYITLSRKNAKKIIWRALCKLQREYDPTARVDNVELTIELSNGSMIICSGAKDESEIEKFRGLAFKKVYIDEAQAFKSYLKELIDDVIEPALYDYDGSLSLIGTPNASCAGVFFDACHQKHGFVGWSNHHWTIFDNPHIKRKSGKTPEQLLEATLKRKGITREDPSFRRESLGQWVYDGDSLIYKFDASRNTFKTLPPDHDWFYILGVDVGWMDADALAVLAFSDTHSNVYMVEEIIKNKQTITELANMIKALESKYQFTKKVMDAGALGKKIQEEIRQRHGIHLDAAEKQRKKEFIELLNDDLRTSRFQVKAEMTICEDYEKLQWDKTNLDKWKEDSSFHSDIADAVLYAWREAKHFAYTQKEKKISRDSNEYMDEYERKEAERMEKGKGKQWYEDGYDFDTLN
jgi:GH43 family beta-xylosidase